METRLYIKVGNSISVDRDAELSQLSSKCVGQIIFCQVLLFTNMWLLFAGVKLIHRTVAMPRGIKLRLYVFYMCPSSPHAHYALLGDQEPQLDRPSSCLTKTRVSVLNLFCACLLLFSKLFMQLIFNHFNKIFKSSLLIIIRVGALFENTMTY